MTTPPPAATGPQPGPTYPVRARRRYPDAPLVGVGVAVFDDAGRVLLVQRSRPPRAGQWGLPGGLVDLGERLADAARREVAEECAIAIEIGDVVGTFEPIERDAEGKVEYHYVVIDFWARHRSGVPQAQDDAAAVAWAGMDELEPFALKPDTRQVIEKAFRAWLAG
ncbi:MAG TPA: NUDIX hydrolase [Caldilineaceae bacterium]|nr:NUDIX hydrolase [Caldilineaceae bacterium]